MYQYVKCIIKQTKQVAYQDGSPIHLADLDAIECLPKQAITYFQLKFINDFPSRIYYEYNCEEFPWINEADIIQRNTKQDVIPNVAYLDRHWVECDNKYVLNSIKLNIGVNSNMYYSYKCVSANYESFNFYIQDEISPVTYTDFSTQKLTNMIVGSKLNNLNPLKGFCLKNNGWFSLFYTIYYYVKTCNNNYSIAYYKNTSSVPNYLGSYTSLIFLVEFCDYKMVLSQFQYKYDATVDKISIDFKCIRSYYVNPDPNARVSKDSPNITAYSNDSLNQLKSFSQVSIDCSLNSAISEIILNYRDSNTFFYSYHCTQIIETKSCEVKTSNAYSFSDLWKSNILSFIGPVGDIDSNSLNNKYISRIQLRTTENLNTKTIWFDITLCSLKVCNAACWGCNQEGNILDCIECNRDYYPLIDKTNECYKNNISIPGYYFNSILGKFSLCYDKCLTCNGDGPNSNNNCLSCKSGYFILNSQCIQCDISCSTCDISLENCTQCNTPKNYYPSFNNTNKCLLSPQNNFVLKSDNKVYPCHESCLVCTDENFGSCTSCNTAGFYFPLENNSSKCYFKETLLDWYYFNNNKFSLCHSGCKICANFIDKCKQCKDNYYMKFPSSTECFDSLPGYFLDDTLFKNCDLSCSSCVMEPQNCTICNYDRYYYPVEDNLSSCHNPCPVGSFLFDNLCRKCNSSCNECIFQKDNCICDGSNCPNCTEYSAAILNSTSCFSPILVTNRLIIPTEFFNLPSISIFSKFSVTFNAEIKKFFLLLYDSSKKPLYIWTMGEASNTISTIFRIDGIAKLVCFRNYTIKCPSIRKQYTLTFDLLKYEFSIKVNNLNIFSCIDNTFNSYFSPTYSPLLYYSFFTFDNSQKTICDYESYLIKPNKLDNFLCQNSFGDNNFILKDEWKFKTSGIKVVQFLIDKDILQSGIINIGIFETKNIASFVYFLSFAINTFNIKDKQNLLIFSQSYSLLKSHPYFIKIYFSLVTKTINIFFDKILITSVKDPNYNETKIKFFSLARATDNFNLCLLSNINTLIPMCQKGNLFTSFYEKWKINSNSMKMMEFIIPSSFDFKIYFLSGLNNLITNYSYYISFSGNNIISIFKKDRNESLYTLPSSLVTIVNISHIKIVFDYTNKKIIIFINNSYYWYSDNDINLDLIQKYYFSSVDQNKEICQI